MRGWQAGDVNLRAHHPLSCALSQYSRSVITRAYQPNEIRHGSSSVPKIQKAMFGRSYLSFLGDSPGVGREDGSQAILMAIRLNLVKFVFHFMTGWSHSQCSFIFPVVFSANI